MSRKILELDPKRFGPQPLLAPDLDAIARNMGPLVALPHWILWSAEWKELKKEPGKFKYTKIPINPRVKRDGTFGAAMSSNAGTWGTFETAATLFEKYAHRTDMSGVVSGNKAAINIAGIGFMLPAMPGAKDTPEEKEAKQKLIDELKLVGLDFDKVRAFDDALTLDSLSESDRKLLETLNTYVESSPTGTGIRAFAFGGIPENGRKGLTHEMYMAGRYLTITGRALTEPAREVRTCPEELSQVFNTLFPADAPKGEKKAKKEIKPLKDPKPAKPAKSNVIEFKTGGDDSEVMDRMFLIGGDKVKQLWNGDKSAYGFDDSSADLGLMSYLARFTGKNRDQMLRLFSQSERGKREKWARDDYQQRTIDRACEDRGDFNDLDSKEKREERIEAARALVGMLPLIKQTTPREMFSENMIGALALLQREDTGLYAEAAALYKERALLNTKLREYVKKNFKLLDGGGQAKSTMPEMTLGDLFDDAPCKDILIPFPYQVTARGVFRVMCGPDGQPTDPEEVCEVPLILTGRTQDIESGEHGFRVSWMRKNAWKSMTVNLSDLLDRNKIINLIDRDFPVNTSNNKEVSDYLIAVNKANYDRFTLALTTSRMGWQGKKFDKGFVIGRTFIQPITGEILQANEDEDDVTWTPGLVQYRGSSAGESQLIEGYRGVGSFDGWVSAIEKVKDYPFAMIAVYTAMTAPMLGILGCQNFVLDINGITSKGKTTCQKCAASVYGNPMERVPDATLHSWDSTVVGAERLSSAINCMPVILNDTQRATKPEIVTKTIYQIEAGRGRTRGGLKGLQRFFVWYTVLISSGEVPITSFSKKAGGTVNRTIELKGMPFGEDNAELVIDLNAALDQNYGWAGVKFVQWIIQNMDKADEWREKYRKATKEYINSAKKGSDASRLAQYAAAIRTTAELVHEALNLPWEFKDPFTKIWRDVSDATSDPLGANEALSLVNSWVHANAVRFEGHGERIKDRESGMIEERRPQLGWLGTWPESDAYVAIYPHHLRKLLDDSGYPTEAILQVWRKDGVLECEKKPDGTYRRFTTRVYTNDGRPQMHKFPMAKLAKDDDADADAGKDAESKEKAATSESDAKAADQNPVVEASAANGLPRTSNGAYDVRSFPQYEDDPDQPIPF